MSEVQKKEKQVSKGEQEDLNLSRGAESERERSTKRPPTGAYKK